MQIHIIRTLICLTIFFTGLLPVQSQNKVISYRLPNGLTVCLNEDHTNQYVTGALVCRIADNNMPRGKETLAHTIEHMLFKGTTDLGTTNWEKEKPFYDAILDQYKKLDIVRDERTRKKILGRISGLSDSASKYIIHGEFYMLQSDIGNGEGFTYSNDYTTYHCTFLPDKIDKWLDLNAHRLLHPVFREFRMEQKVISQEYFERSNDNSIPRWDYIFKAIYGKPSSEELSNDVFNLSLTDVIDFYNRYYVPENMALVISGNFNTGQVKTKIMESFSGIPSRKGNFYSVPASPVLVKREIQNAYYDNQRSVTFLFRGARHLSNDFYPFRVFMNMMTNGSNGLADSLWHNGLIKSFHTNWNWDKNGCLYYIYVNPYEHQSLKTARELILQQVQKIANGEFDEDLLLTAKRNICREIDLEKESLFPKVSDIAQHFVYGMEIPEIIDMNALFNSVTREDILRVAHQYLGNYSELLPFSEKKKIFQKQTGLSNMISALPKKEKSVYAYHFDSIPDTKMNIRSFRPEDVFDTIFNEVRYFSSINTTHQVFQLKLLFNLPGEVQNILKKVNFERRFEYLTPEGMSAWEFRNQLALLGCTFDFSQSGSETIVLNINGMDQHFRRTVQLFSALLKNPDINKNEINTFLTNSQENAFASLSEPMKDAYQKLFRGMTEISYYGSLSKEVALSAVKQQFDVKESRNASFQNSVYQYDSENPQVKVWLYSKPTSAKYRMQYLVLKNYLFRILWDEIRVANGLAYVPGTDVRVPSNNDTPGFLFASVRTKDFQISAVSEILRSILKNLPERESVFENARQQVRNEYLKKVLEPRTAFESIKESRKKRDFSDDISGLDKLTFYDFMKFYRDQFGHSNARIEIYGNANLIGRANIDRMKKELELRAEL